jgi:hypothetical protein
LLNHLFLGGPPPVPFDCPAGGKPALRTIALEPEADTTIWRDWNNSCGPNDSLQPVLSVATREGINRHHRALIRFALPADLQAGGLRRARLRLHALAQGEYKTNCFVAAPLSEEWDPLECNWCERSPPASWSAPGGDYSEAPASAISIPSRYESTWHTQNGPIEEWFEWDVTTIAAGWLSGELPRHGFLIRQVDIPNREEEQVVTFASMEHEDEALRPQLVLELAD